LAAPGLEVKEIFNRTGADVAQVSSNRQIPAIYSQFFGTAYFGERPPETGESPRPQPPAFVPQYGGGKDSRDNARLWTLGASAGTSFGLPLLVATVHGTLAPFKYSFLELGCDFGFLSAFERVTGYSSVTPFANFAFFVPFNKAADRLSGGWYAGAGAGYATERYDLQTNGELPLGYVAFNLSTGFNLWDMIDVSYTLRAKDDFDPGYTSSKLSLGYVYRFKTNEK
jgi:hypothetical protein